MLRLRFAYSILIICLGSRSAPILAQTLKPASQEVRDNDTLRQIVERDQAVRTPVSIKDDQPSRGTDADRRNLVRGIIDRHELHTGLDYANAALVFQHGSTADDYLLAHALAVIGASKGNRLALWLTAATLDRYLGTLKQPQIYGTQFSRKPLGPFEAAPMNAGLLTDAIRQETDVPIVPEQAQQVKELNRQLQSKSAKP